MAGLTDAELFGSSVPQATPPTTVPLPTQGGGVGLTDAQLFPPQTAPVVQEEEDPRSWLAKAGDAISSMTVDDVTDYLKEHGELPGGLGGAATGALIGFLSPMPGGALIGSIIGGAVGSGSGSAVSDVIASPKEFELLDGEVGALSDIDAMDALKEAGLSVGFDVLTLGLGRYVGKPIWNAIKNRVSKEGAKKVLKELAETGVEGAADVGNQQARYQSQQILAEEGETLSKFQLGLTDSFGKTLENLGRHSIGGAGVYANSQKRIINVVSEKLQELSNVTSLSADAFGKAYTGGIKAGKKALGNAYKAREAAVFKEMGSNVMSYPSSKKAIDGWPNYRPNITPNKQSKLTENELGLVDKLSVLVKDAGSPRQLLALDTLLKENMGAALKAAKTGAEYRRITLFGKRVKAGIAKDLKDKVSPKAMSQFKAMNREFHQGISALTPKVNEGYLKKMDASTWTKIGEMFAGGGDAQSIQAGMDSIRATYKNVSPKMAREMKLPFKTLEEAEKAVATGYITKKLGSLTAEAMDPRKFMKEAINLSDSTYAAATRAALGPEKFTSYKKLVNLMAHAHDTPKAGMFSLVQRAKEASAVASVGQAVASGSSTLAISAAGKISGLFAAPWFLSRLAMKPSRVNKMLAVNAMGAGQELKKTKVLTTIVNDVITEMYESGMTKEEVLSSIG